MKLLKLIAIGMMLAVVFPACKKDNDVVKETPKVTTGVYVLSEGLFNRNNTTLTFYSFGTSTASTDFYATKNGSGLGDTGNDILLYGGKIYIVMNVSSYVEVANALTAASLAKIQLKTSTNAARQPRYVVGYKNKVLVTSYDGTVAVIDTASLVAEKFINVGKNPEQMAISGDKLYVANSGGLSPGFDSTLSVIDLNTMTETAKVTVGVNPGSVAADNAGNIYVGCAGNYGNIKPKLVKLSAANNSIVKSADTAVGRLRFYDGFLYATGRARVRKLNLTDFSQAADNFVTDGTAVKTPYGINIDADNGDVYITDAKDYVSSGEVFCFDKTGKKKFSFSVNPGLNPNTVVFIKQ